AESAGIAFQLTNILRDLREDACRGRCYLPQEDLQQFGYRLEELLAGEQNERFRALMRFQVERARRYYDAARPLSGLLAPPGRAGSFHDAASGQLIDTCQHVSMGCCTNFAHFCRTVGISDLLEPQPYLHFMTADGRLSRFQADALPAPLHLARSFWGAHYLSA